MSSIRGVKNVWSRLIDNNKDFKAVSKIHIDLVERLEKVEPLVASLELSNDDIAAKLAEGIPYLEGQEEKIDLQFAMKHFRELSNWTGLGDSRSIFKKMGKKATDKEVEQLLRAWLTGDSTVIDQFANQYNLQLDVLFVVARYSLLPTLNQYRLEFEKTKVFNEEEWMKDYCPVCGDQHGLAEYRGSERFRHFRCLSCAGDWVFWRIACPHCDNKDHNKLSTLMIKEEKASFQIDTCEECYGYVKGINKLDPSSPMFLLLDDFATFHLDLLAKEKGYHRQGTSTTLQ
ncbi:formate dehydrogenase accessory protein FdhE [Anaerobacillus alkaliphilus]|uniref:Formate dehydrogenase accessory protein FdhE n=1 Tax=Anaerobacillus alkaliphilus TaxID=1548597 RepID=A0A4Q0VTI3_9BACI|nr:formate dehydrogenase accessory protein FdhE [Anaerobacillus alkaliphilus]RXJ01900.1 formate dehydrogenase accessory protein FdhE [Anaerobacillus alkaliphilus]